MRTSKTNGSAGLYLPKPQRDLGDFSNSLRDQAGVKGIPVGLTNMCA